jgi:hypothetical protein
MLDAFFGRAGDTSRARVARFTHRQDHQCRRMPGHCRRVQQEEV